jgi:MFS family permease
VKPFSASSATIAAAIGLITLVGMSLSLFIPLLAIAMENIGVSSTMSGLNTAFAGIGTLCVVPFVPRLAARFGLQPIIRGAILLSAMLSIAFYLTPFWAWFPLRFLFGALIGTLFVLSEYWINAAAPPDRRGTVMGIYATMLAIGFVLGPVVLNVTGSSGIWPYLAGVVIYLLALGPLWLAGARLPVIQQEEHGGVLPYMTAVPVATFAGLVFGAIETGAFALFPAYGMRNGMPESSAALLISIVVAGNIVSQIPIGWLSDHTDRRKLLLLCGVVGVLGAIAMPLTMGVPIAFHTALFIWGGFTGGLYTVGLAHLGARFSGHELANANAAFVMLYSIGLIVGPPFVGLGMDVLGSHGFAWSLAAMLAAYACLAAVRIAQRETA